MDNSKNTSVLSVLSVNQDKGFETFVSELRAEFEDENQIVDFWRGRVVFLRADARQVRLFWPPVPNRAIPGGGWEELKIPLDVPASDLETMRRTHANRMKQRAESSANETL